MVFERNHTRQIPHTSVKPVPVIEIEEQYSPLN